MDTPGRYSANLIPCYTIVEGCYGFTLVVRVFVCQSVQLPYVHPSIFSFPDDDLSKYQWIFAKLCMCIDIVEI